MLAVEGAVENLAAIVVGDELAGARAPHRLSPVGEAGAGAVGRRHQIRRAAIDRNLEDRGGKPRPVHDRLVVAGQESRAVAQLADAQRSEIAFEELPSLLLRDLAGRKGAPAHVPQRGVHGTRLALRRGGADQRPAARKERGKGRSVIIRRPAVERVPVDRLELRLREAQRFRSRRRCLHGGGGAGGKLGLGPRRGVTGLDRKAEQQQDRRNARQAVLPAAIPGRAPPRRDPRSRHGTAGIARQAIGKPQPPPPCVTGIDCETT